MFEKCVGIFGDPQHCSFVQRFGQLYESVLECVEKSQNVGECLRDCFKRCRGEGCEEMCLGAVETISGMVVAKDMAENAATLVSRHKLDPAVAVATVFNVELGKVKKMRCPEKGVGARILTAAVLELYSSFEEESASRRYAQDVLLLLAPALAEAYRCMGESAFGYLDGIRPFVGEEVVKKIVAAMEEGVVIIGDVEIRFKPVKTSQ